MNCHEVDYEIHGDDLQMVEVELDPGESVIAEAGTMNFMEEGITFEARLGDGSQPDQGFFSKWLSKVFKKDPLIAKYGGQSVTLGPTKGATPLAVHVFVATTAGSPPSRFPSLSRSAQATIASTPVPPSPVRS